MCASSAAVTERAALDLHDDRGRHELEHGEVRLLDQAISPVSASTCASWSAPTVSAIAERSPWMMP